MTGSVLVDVNDSPASGRAVEWAAARAADLGAPLRLVHVMHESVRQSGDTRVADAAESSADALLERAAATVAQIAPSAEVTSVIEYGDPLKVFVRLSEDAELIVVGSDTSTDERPSRRGTRGFRIAAASKTAVAVIPDLDLTGRRGVVVGADGSEPSQNALAFAIAEADRLGEPLIAVNAWTNPVVYGYDVTFPVEYLDDLDEAGQRTLDHALEGITSAYPNVDVQRVVVEGDPVIALADAAGTASLLVIGSHGRGAVARLLLGSVSHGLLAHLVAPTVVVR